jgi:hypothetical protein
MNHPELQVATWNANGILNKKNEIEIFLHNKNIDICLISETHLTKQCSLNIKGYTTYQTNHPDNQAKGGSAILVKETITQYEGLHLQKEDVQLTTIVIRTRKNNQRLNIGAIYIPPRYNLKKETYKLILNHLGERFIVGGDFNAKHTDWGSRLTTTKGRQLRQAITEMSCNFHSTDSPTYWPTDQNKIPDLLDFFITRKVSNNFIELSENFDLNSDHSAVILTLSANIISKAARPALVNRSTDWESFKLDLQESINLKIKLKTWEQLEMATETFTRQIQKAAFDNTAEILKLSKGTNYPHEIRELVKEKRRARRKWQQTRHPADKNVLNNKTQTLRRKIQELKEESKSIYLQNLTANKMTNYSLWKASRNTLTTDKPTPPIRKNHGSWAISNSEKAELFAEHLAATFTTDESGNNSVPTNIEHDNKTFEHICPVTPKEVSQEIKQISLKKSPGYDLITGEILKHLPRKAVVMITMLINAAFRLKHVPSCWKVAEVIMLPKAGKPPNEVKSYRPISLLPLISKLFEKLLLKRLKPIIEEKKLIPDHQFGFRQMHSTIDQVHRISDVIEQALEDKKICSAVFLDVAQAFDKVWHEGLILKLQNLLPMQYVDVLKSYISERLFRVKHKEEYSQIKEIKAGVPQGSVLGPILYLLYTSDIPHMDNAVVATFADDTALVSVNNDIVSSTNALQLASDKLVSWTKKWRIKLNEQKSTHINFTNKKISQILPLYINGTKVPYANTAKYLGMTLDTKLKWKEHLKKKRAELGLKYRDYYWLIGRHSKLSIFNKTLIYNQILKPVWLYGIQVWGCASDSNITPIQTFQNIVLRNIVNAPWYVRNSDIHRDLRVATVKEEISKYAAKHKDRLQRHQNPEALQLLNNENHLRRLKRKKPFDLA